MSNLFDDIEQVDSKLGHGWCTLDKMNVLASLIVSTRPQVVVELGVWAGRSLIPMALALRYNKVGKAIAIDPWDSKASAEGYLIASLNSEEKQKDWKRSFIIYDKEDIRNIQLKPVEISVTPELLHKMVDLIDTYKTVILSITIF